VGKAASDLAHEFFTVLDLRLPPRLNEISDLPEGSRSDLANPEQDQIGTVTTDKGKTEILVDRVVRGKNQPVWLFSSKTLDLVPELYEDLSTVPVETLVPAFLIETRIAQIPLFHYLALVILPSIYFLLALVSRVVRPRAGRLRRRLTKQPDLPDFDVIPPPIRILILAAIISLALSKIGWPLLARQVWSTIAWVLTALALVWLLFLLNSVIERRIRRRLDRLNNTGAASILHLGRRVVDVLVVFAGVVIVLYHFGFNPTAALAGLGIGGIAIAFAAQKTLENVIGGISIIFDQVVRVGDYLKTGETQGTVEGIGLRSTRIRTLNRTVVSVPNGLISGVTLENFAERDKFWFRHMVGLRYETTAAQMRSIVEGLTTMLQAHPRVERDSVRVRFQAFGPSSLDVEVFAYLFARDFNHFLELQADFLLQIMEVIEAAEAHIAFPSQTMYLETNSNSDKAKEVLVRAASPDQAAGASRD
jgi:MscS family membrane protein